LAALGGPAANCTGAGANSTLACLIDDTLAATASKSGYNFTVTNLTGAPVIVTYSSLAKPIVVGQSGQRAFCSDQSGVIRYNQGGTACTNADPAL
jgi:type IV pilus assembly protein PilA